MGKFEEINLTGLKKYSIKDRPSKVHIKDFAKPSAIRNFLSGLPDILAGKDFKELIDKCVIAHKNNKPVIVALGGHVVKCGLSLYIIEMIETGLIKALASNGSVVIHDFEIAEFGKTSEYVASALEDGSFGMAEETCDGINNIIKKAAEEKLGYGEAIGKHLVESNAPNNNFSLLASAYKNNIPFTVHV
ncbi:MAG: hypothetical protein KAT74_11150, partial [Candidatus Cloacimonetes bacterium]|nr:hypothetical protein [Candidatus Cloacimonadota bacterium]